MVAIFTYIIVSFVISDITAFLNHNRIPIVRPFSRQFAVFDTQVGYDPFESDPRIKAMLITELTSIKEMNTSSIKVELVNLGFQSKGFVDKSELERILARRRVKINLQEIQDSEIAARLREKKADLIEDELENIRSSGMTELLMIKELQILKVKIDVGGDLIQQLAFARLGIQLASIVTKEKKVSEDKKQKDLEYLQSDEAKAISSTVNDFKGVYDRFVKNVEEIKFEEIVFSPMVNITSVIKNDTVIKQAGTMNAVQKFTQNLGLTKSELAAEAMFLDKHIDSNSSDMSTSKEVKKEVVLSASEIALSLAEASTYRSFDEIVYWARQKPRGVLAQLLEYKGDAVPKYAPRSALAAILADSLLVDRGQETLDRDRFDVEDNFGGPQAPSFDDMNLEREKESEEKKENRQVTSSVGTTGGNKFSNNNNMKKVKRKVNKEDMGSFFFEKELLQKFRNMFSDAISLIFSPEVLSDIETGTTRASFQNLLSQIISLGCRSAVTFATWAGGDLVSSKHVLFIATFYSLITKKGIW
eukprot:CAMPEP_0119043794 /NCGR_PEP_ID=MMETSP1177-20130426/26054_1 /TAXON_ID=2985 /ORGANISM="Ochromonas sp, Strain CCMP1899" /LENGTH=529 /DNA_ID=CAMNT_0007012733 /DNA_START=23 /DNA_END=1609 /DNA_ORIENTATION=-